MTVTCTRCPNCGGHVVFICFELDGEGYLYDFVCNECGNKFDREIPESEAG
jgi:transcription elongation factor Elf1